MEEKEINQNIDAAEAIPEETPEARKKRYAAEAYDWFDTILFSVLAVVVIFTLFTRLSSVDGNSMLPTLHDKERLLVTDMFYKPQHNDIVVLWSENLPSEDGNGMGKAIVKRVIGVGGDKINIDFSKGVVYRNGEALPLEVSDGVLYEDGHAINDYTRAPIDFSGEITVPEGQIFVLGDNRNGSSDSRDDRIGLVDENYIIGKVYLRIMPFDKFGGVV